MSDYEISKTYWQLCKETVLGNLARFRGLPAEIPTEESLRAGAAAYAAMQRPGGPESETDNFVNYGVRLAYSHLAIDLGLVADGRPPTWGWALPKLRREQLRAALRWVEEARDVAYAAPQR